MAAARHSVVVLRAADWRSAPCVIATTAAARRRGLSPSPGPLGLVMGARSIHSFGLVAPVCWVALDATARVVGVGILEPGRVVVCWRARVFVEQAAGMTLPARGDRVAVDRLRPWSGP